MPYAAETTFLATLAAHAATAAANARLLAAAREKVALEERQRLARELHDSVSQSLSAIQLGAQMARERLDRDPAGAAQPIDYVLRLAEAGQAEMRALIFELRPEALETQGLVAALNRQIEAVRARQGVSAKTISLAEPELPIEIDPNGSFPGHLGLRSMHERATGTGGSLEVVSARGRGTLVVVRVPSAAPMR